MPVLIKQEMMDAGSKIWNWEAEVASEAALIPMQLIRKALQGVESTEN